LSPAPSLLNPNPTPPPHPANSPQVYLRKLGGANVKVKDLGPVTKVGSARCLGPAAADDAEAVWEYEAPAAAADVDATAAAAAVGDGGRGEEGDAEGRVFVAKRKRKGGVPGVKGAPVSGGAAAATSG